MPQGASQDISQEFHQKSHPHAPEANTATPHTTIVGPDLSSSDEEFAAKVKPATEKAAGPEPPDSRPRGFTSRVDGENLALQIGALRYLECSSLTGEGVDELLNTAARALVSIAKREQKGNCVLQ